ncbi:cytochrome c-type biogenesis protein CcmH [Aurantiacibacter spongiae]|uniref:Cytochrome c-type biogenesis protein n=1 Tax=Aurantiacibacter spongiae TaxID=2488860 RepID=A0A3N5CYS1_9SPHN|nr:cytochrome c-type biogenesis protein CcmH [Aurantiacibacter spongiae]
MCLLTALALLAEPLAAQGNLPPAPYAYTELADPAQEREARELMETLRCLTCQSQSIADSDAAMAGDMRHQVRTRIAAGESPDHIREWMVARYGDYISYEPRLAATTWPLFALPVLLLVLSGLIVWRRMGARRGE